MRDAETAAPGPLVMPPALNTAAGIAAFVARCRGAQVVIVGTDGAERLCAENLAAGVLVDLLRAQGCAEVQEMSGVAPALIGTDAHAAGVHAHERRWLAAGDLLGHLVDFDPGKGPWVMIYRDPWSVHVRKQWARPPLAQILISDLPTMVSGPEATYWQDISGWLKSLEGILTVAPSILLAMASDSDDIGRVDGRLLGPAVGGRRMLIDEADGFTWDPHHLSSVLSHWPDCEVVLLSSAIGQYRADRSDLIDRCRIALDRSDLAVSVYRHLIAASDVYVAPMGLPYGQLTLTALSPEALVVVPPEVVLPSRWNGRRSTLPSASAGRPQTAGAPRPALGMPAPAPVDTGNPSQLPRGDSGSFAQWWGRLSVNPSAPGPTEITPPTPVAATVLPAPAAAPASGQPRPPGAVRTGSVDFAFLVCCHKYLQRFRIFMQSIVRQDYPLDRIEVCVAAYGNPDGLFEYIGLLQMAHPKLRIAVAEVPVEMAKNKGKQVNLAFARSTAPVVMVTDCDLVLPTDFVRSMLREHRQEHVIGCWRTPMSIEVTAQIITGNLDPIAHFDILSQQWDKVELDGGVRQGMLGYCQVVARGPFARIGYPEDFEVYNQSDIVFIDRLNAIGVTQRFLKDRHVLHLAHPRDWTGTKVFL